MRFRMAALVFSIGLGLSVPPAWAHHSFANFDMLNGTKTLTGVVTRFEWTNPHSYLYLDAPDQNGKVESWSVEFHAIGQLLRLGLTKDTFKPGDKVTVDVFPARDGSHLTFFSSVKLADGRTFKFGGVPNDISKKTTSR